MYFLKTAIISFFSLVVFVGSPKHAAAETPKNELNVLLITIDTLRADRLSCYDPGFVQTPNIDALAAKGIIFRSAFAHNPMTLPSHTNILLGTTPLYHGVHTNTNFMVEDKHTTLAEHLKTFNYKTAAFVSAATLDSRLGLAQGFDIYDDTFDTPGLHKFENAERKAEEVIQPALSWLKSQNGLWFAWIHLFDPHDPYEPPPPFNQTYSENLYNGEVAYTDFALGKIFDYLKKSNLDKNTLVILTSDHGESLGEHGEITHGFFSYNSTIWIPLIFSYPGIQPGARTELAAHIDIFPTVCDILGIDQPSVLQGLSLKASLDGKKLPERRLYFESLAPYYSEGWAPLKGFIYRQMKFIDSPIPELYDLGTDFTEKVNLASQKDLKSFMQDLITLEDRFSSKNTPAPRTIQNKDMLDKMRSLGYAAGSSQEQKKEFGPEDDVKIKMPVYNAVLAAFSQKDRGAITQGITTLEDISQDANTLPMAYYYLAELYKERGEIDRGLETLKAGMEKFPQHYDLLIEYVDSLIEKGDFQMLIKTVTTQHMPRMEQDASLYNKLGLAYSKVNQLDNALDALQRAAAIDDEYADIFQNMGSIHLSKFIVSKDSGEYKKAEDNFLKVLALNPRHANAHNSLGALYFGNRQLDKAVDSWETAVRFNEDLGKTYYYLGLANLSKNIMDKAFTYFSIYKQKYYETLTDQEKSNLDEMIARSRK